MRKLLARNLWMPVLGIWLIVWGLSAFGLTFPGLAQLLAIVAIAAGLLLLMGR